MSSERPCADEVLAAPRLAERPSRAPDYARENAALAALAETMARAPAELLDKLVALALELCRAGSAGISILEGDEGSERFRWHAIAGVYAPYLNGTIGRDGSPCGVVIALGAAVLFDNPGRIFPEFASVTPAAAESLLVPFHVRGRALGTVWLVAHDAEHRFDSEDARLLTSLSSFAAAGYELRSALAEAERQRQELSIAHEQLVEEAMARETAALARQELLRQLSSAQEDERRRLARDLHDQAGQLLAGLSLSIRALASHEGLPEAVVSGIAEAEQHADELARQVHGLAFRLRPAALDDLGLAAAIEQLARDCRKSTGLEVDVEVAQRDPNVPSELESVIYRVVQESLTNVIKHARAHRVSVVVGRHGGILTAIVDDDGVGFDDATHARLGLVGMRERVELAGGELEIESRPGAGTTIVARLPLRPAP